MEVERERYIQEVVGVDKDGKAIYGAEHKVGATERFEFGSAADVMSQVIGGGYQQNWNPDFLQRELGKDGTTARLYFDKKFAVDIGDPESEVARKKRKQFFRNGFGYLCIPSGFAQDAGKLRKLYEAAKEEYFAYEQRHPRPAVLQEATVIDEKGNLRRVFLTAQDIRVGGGVVGSVASQTAELKQASKLSKKEIKQLKLHTKLHRKIRQHLQDGTPFRNPFIAPGVRKYPVKYRENA